MDIPIFLSRVDNYNAILRDPVTGHVAVVDAPDSAAIIRELDARGWKLDTLLITHKHFDHIEGVPALVARYQCAVVAPLKAKAEVPQATRYVTEGDRVSLGSMVAEVWETPGHCEDHISFYLADKKVFFAGDTMFTMGCGRIFGCLPETLHASLQRIAGLPEDTLIYSGHEYTLSNARFCAHMEPKNPEIIKRYHEVGVARERGDFTVPTTIGQEKATNVFLRAKTAAEFARLREAKNSF